MLKEFREFIAKGNMLDLAVGIVIGVAFAGVVASFVKDIFTPIISIPGKVDLGAAKLELKPDLYLTYGAFLNTVINFLIVGFAVFLIVKAANKMKRKQEVEPEAAPAPAADVVLLTEIRDLLKAKG